MKHLQFVVGLLVGTALGGAVVASTGVTPGAGLDKEAVKTIVRETINEEPQLILDSVQKFQQDQRGRDISNASEALKDKAFRDQVYSDKNVGSVGPKDSKRVVVEFFDYNCPACKMQYKSFDALVKKDPTVRVIFREFPIFGPTSDTNARIGLAVARLAPEKYFDFYEAMHGHTGHAEEKDTFDIIKQLGLDVEKVKAESKKPEVQAEIDNNRKLGEKLHIQGTPTLVVGDQVIPHAASPEDLLQILDAKK